MTGELGSTLLSELKLGEFSIRSRRFYEIKYLSVSYSHHMLRIQKVCGKNGTQDPEWNQDPGQYEDPRPYEDLQPYEDPGSYENLGSYEDPGPHEDPGPKARTQ